MNYLSGWIENLGVVPLFWFWAFLLLPILAFLFARRLRVTRVLETIIFSLRYKFFESMNLTKIANYVKIVAITFYFTATHCPASGQDYYLGKGEVTEIKVNIISNFTIGNREVIKVKPLSKNTLLVKGDKLGHSELLIWNQGKPSPERINFTVISKKAKTEQNRIEQALKKAEVKFSFDSKTYYLHGLVEESHQYKQLIKLFKEQNHIDYSHSNLSPSLKRSILIELYEVTSNSLIDQLDCQFRNLKLICQYDQSIKISRELKELIEDRIFIQFIPIHVHRNRFFRAKLNIIQFENQNGDFLHLGLDKMEGNLLDLFSRGINALIETNSIKLNQNEINVSTIAKPETIIRFDKPALIKIGADLPYQSQSVGGIGNTQWKFAGLEIKIDISPKGELILVNYETAFTRPSENSAVSGTHESSSGFIAPGSPIKLFDITYQSLGNEESKLPYISSIPILGRLFRSSTDKSSFKKVSAYLLIEEIIL